MKFVVWLFYFKKVVFSPNIPKQEGKSQGRSPKGVQEELENSAPVKWNDARSKSLGIVEKNALADSSSRVTQLVALQQTADQSFYHQKSEARIHSNDPLDTSPATQGSEEVIQGMFARGASTLARGAMRQVGQQVRGTVTAAAPRASAGASSSAGMVGKLLTGVGVANAGVETYKAFKDEKSDGKYLQKGGNMAMAAAGGAFGRFGVVGNAVSAISAAGKADISSVPGFFGFPQASQDPATGAPVPNATPTESTGPSMLDPIKTVTAHATDGPEAILHGMEVTSAAFEKFFPQVYQVAGKSKTLKFLKYLPTVGIPLADVKTFAGNLIENQVPIEEFLEKQNQKMGGLDPEELFQQFGSGA